MNWKKRKINEKPALNVCPEDFCFFWVPSGGYADLSGSTHDSFEGVSEAVKRGQEFPDGGCSCSFGRCFRDTQSVTDKDWYEPCESILKREKLPELFFCNPQFLDEEDKQQYNLMAELIWKLN